MYCSNGHLLKPGARFCTTCGAMAASSTAPSHGSIPPVGYVAAGTVATSGFAIASLVLGILGGAVLAIIFGFVALSQIKKRGQRGRGLAIAGVILGFVWSAIIVAAIIAGVVIHSHHSTQSYRDGYSYGYNTATSASDCDWYANGPGYDSPTLWEQGCNDGFNANP